MLKHLAAGVRSRLCSIQLGFTFECEANTKKKIWLIDHIYNLWRRAAAEFETPLVRNYASAIAWHGYAGEPDWVQRVQKMYPDVGMNWTEGGPDYTDPNHAKDWANWSQRFMGILRKCCRSAAWNLALDEHSRPNLGPFTCGGLVTVNSQSKNISPSRQFGAVAHYSRFVRRGAYRIDSPSTRDHLSHCSFENPNRARVLVATNSGPGRTCHIQVEGQSAGLSLTPNSVTTLL